MTLIGGNNLLLTVLQVLTAEASAGLSSQLDKGV